MNDIYNLINSIWLPVILGALCAGNGIYMAITGELGLARRRNDNRLLKDKKQYVRGAMWLMFFMALGCLIMALIIQFMHNDTIATIESLSWLVVFGILWKRNEDRYGPL